MWCTCCFRTKDFPSSPLLLPQRRKRHLMLVHTQKKTRPSLSSVLQFLLKTKHPVLFKDTKGSCYHSVFKPKLGFFSFFNMAWILGSHSVLGTFLLKFCSMHNLTLLATDFDSSKDCWEVPKPVPEKTSTCSLALLEHSAMHQLWPSKQVAPSKWPPEPPLRMAAQLQNCCVLISYDRYAGLQLAGPDCFLDEI